MIDSGLGDDKYVTPGGTLFHCCVDLFDTDVADDTDSFVFLSQ